MSKQTFNNGIVHCDDGLDNLIRSRSLTFSMERQKKLFCHNQNRLQNEHKCPTPINHDCNDDCDNDNDDDDGDDCDESLLSDMAYYTSLKDGDDMFGTYGDELLMGRDQASELQNNVCNKRNKNREDKKSLHLRNHQLQSRSPSFKLSTTSHMNENNKSKLLKFAPRWKFASKGFQLSKSSSSGRSFCPNKQNHKNKNGTVNQYNTLSTSSSSHASSRSSTKNKNRSHFSSIRTRSNRPASNLSNETATTFETDFSRSNRTTYSIPYSDRTGRSVNRVKERSKGRSLVIEKRLDLQDDDSKVGEQSYYSSASFLESTSTATPPYKYTLREAGEAERRDDDADNHDNKDRIDDSNLGNGYREECAHSVEEYTSPPPSQDHHQSVEDIENNSISHSESEYCDLGNNDMNSMSVRSNNIITERTDESFSDSEDQQILGMEKEEQSSKVDEILPKKCSPANSKDEHPHIFYGDDEEIIGESTVTFEPQTHETHTNGSKSIDNKYLPQGKEREEDGDSLFCKVLNHTVENSKLSDNRDFDKGHNNDDDEYQQKQVLSSFSQKNRVAADNEAFDSNNCLELNVRNKVTNDSKKKRLSNLQAAFSSSATEAIERSTITQNSSEINGSKNEHNFQSNNRGSFNAEYEATEVEANALKRKDVDSLAGIISRDSSSLMLQETRTDKNATYARVNVNKQHNLESGESDLPCDLFSDSKNTDAQNEQHDLKHNSFEDLESLSQDGEENASPVALSAHGDTENGDLHSAERGKNRCRLSNGFADDTTQKDINSLIDFFSKGNNSSGRRKRVVPSKSNSEIKLSSPQPFHDTSSRNIGEERCDEKGVTSCTKPNLKEEKSHYPDGLKVSFCYRKIHSIDFKENFRPRLFQIRRIGKITRRFQVPANIKSLNHGDSFVLDTWDKVYTWFGTDSSCFEKSKSAVLAHNLIMSRSGRSIAEIDVQEDNQDFWTHLGGKDKIMEASCVTDDNIPQNQAVKMYILAAGEQSKVIVEEVRVNRNNLLTERVCLIVTDNTIYVWIGKASSTDHQKNSMNVAKKLLMK